MRALFFLLFMPAVLCTPMPFTDHAKMILRLWANESDVDVASDELRKEASEYGLTGDEYFRVCTEQGFVMTSLEDDQWSLDDHIDKHYAMFKNLNTSDKVMSILKARAPRKYKIVMSRIDLFEKHSQDIDNASQRFLREIGQSYLELMVKISKPPVTLLWKEWINAFREIRSNYNALPITSKQALEKTFCFKTTLRKMDELEKDMTDFLWRFRSYKEY